MNWYANKRMDYIDDVLSADGVIFPFALVNYFSVDHETAERDIRAYATIYDNVAKYAGPLRLVTKPDFTANRPSVTERCWDQPTPKHDHNAEPAEQQLARLHSAFTGLRLVA